MGCRKKGNEMTRNVGTTDRWLRAIVVAPLLVWGSTAIGVGTGIGVVLLAAAAIMVVTAATGFCPLYRLFGFDTRRHRHQDAVASR